MRNDILLRPGFICFTTRDYAIESNQSLPSASRSLSRQSQGKVIVRITKGVWANTKHPYFSPLGCVPILLGGEQGYISFLTALHRLGAISPIPPTIQVATTGHSRKLRSPIGTFEFLQLKPQMMVQGVEWSEAKLPYRMATAEKAFLDTLYISTRRGKRFSSLPEVDFKFNEKLFQALLKKQVGSERIRAAIINRMTNFFR